MSTYATIGPPVVLDGPIPRPRPYGLMSVAQEPVSVADGDRWALGAAIWPYPTDEPGAWDPCGTNGSPAGAKNEGARIPLPQFGSFQLYLPITCRAPYVGNDFEQWRARATAAFDATEGYGIEKEFAIGTAISSNPALVRDPELIESGAAYTTADALAELEQYLAVTGFGRMGVIHADPQTATDWAGEHLIERVGQQLQTKIGTPVVVGTGYVGAVPDGQDPLEVGQAWAFVTGPVLLRRSEIMLVPQTLTESIDKSTNMINALTERAYVVAWDTAVHGAILIDRN